MLFNSYLFLFGFLPITLTAFHVARLWSRRVALDLVAAASLFFYGYWDPRYLALLIPSLVINYWLGEQIARTRRRAWLVVGVAANLAVIAWFKYSLFFYLTATRGAAPPDFLRGIALPLGISFITFQKIAYLVDIWRGHPKAETFDRWAFFVLFFPQLIAGPIVLFRNIDRQIRRNRGGGAYFRAAFQFGLMLFAIGLFKKVVIADSLAPYADDVFRFAARRDADLTPADAWIGALAYSLQLYFDFSGYSDMAIGLGRMFGFRLPVNFRSPYQATSIVDFWRRWHVTLTSFFREYVYIPLGGNRKGLAKQAVFILFVFALTGLWHGAGWTFVAWGCIHGVLVLVNHIWTRSVRPQLPAWPGEIAPRVARISSRLVTLLAVVCLWVVFRAPSASTAVKVLRVMFGLWGKTNDRAFPDLDLYYVVWPLIVLFGIVALFAPNSLAIVRRLRHGRILPSSAGDRTHPAPGWQKWMPALVTGGALYFAIASIGHVQSKFIYFNF